MRYSARTRIAALALSVALASSASAEEARKLSPKRTELLEAVEEYHTLQRRRLRGGHTDHELHDLKHSLRRAHERVKVLKAQILKEERRSDDYYQDDPYPSHKKDPETGGPWKD